MKCAYDYSKLKGRITEKFNSQHEFAVFLGKTDCQITNLLNGRVKFTQEIIAKWCDVLEIDVCDIGTYFFTLEVAV